MKRYAARIALAGLLAMSCQAALAATLTVPTEYWGIGSAMASAQPGDTVYVLAGTYTEEGIVVRDRVNLVGEGAGATFLTGTTPIMAGSGGTIEGFTITGHPISSINKSPTIRRNVIRNVVGYAITIGGNAWAVVTQNVIYNNNGGVGSNFTSVVANNTIVDNVAGSGIVSPGGAYRTENNIVVGNSMGLASCTSDPSYNGGFNDVWRNPYGDWRCLYSSPGDISADPLFAKAPRTSMQGYEVLQTELGYDTARVQWDWTDRVFPGDHVEVAYDKVDRVVTEVTYAVDVYEHTRIRFSPPLAAPVAPLAILDWGTTSDFTYDFTLLPGSPAIDAGNPDPFWSDADGSRNDMGASGGMGYPPIFDPVPPAPVSNLVANSGDTEIRLTWAPPADADLKGYLVVRREGAAPTGTPTDGSRYDWYGTPYMLGDGQVVYFGFDPTATSFVDVDRYPGITYHYAVFAFDAFFNYSPAATASAASFHTARTWVVDAAGTGDFTTIAGAMDAARATDTVIVMPGVYAESVTFKNGIRLRGESRDGTVLTLPAADAYSVISASGVSYGSIENLTLQWNSTGWNTALSLEGGTTIDLFDVTVKGFSVGAFYRGDYWSAILPPRMPTIRGCTFEADGTALWLWDRMSPTVQQNVFLGGGIGVDMKYASSPEIADNDFTGNLIGINVYEESRPLIHDNRITGGTTGISHAWSSHSTIYRNVISGNSGIGIYAVSYSSPVIQDNIVAKNGADGLWLFLNWPRAYNNTIVENGGNGLLIEYYGSVDTRNNIIAFNGGWGTSAGEDYYPGYPSLSYNDVYGNALGNTSPQTALQVGNISADPRFVDRAAGNYQLGLFSPAFDAGDPDPSFNDVDGSRNDMGAYGGPRAFPTTAPPVPGDLTLDMAVIVLPDYAFKNEAANRKQAFQDKINLVLASIEAARGETDPAVRQATLETALGQLENDLLAKCDGWFGGNLRNDWIVTQEAQRFLYPIIMNLIGEVRILLASP